MHRDKVFSFWKQKGVVQVLDPLDGKKYAIAKMLPTCPTVDKSMVRWDNDAVAKHLVNKEMVLSAFEKQVRDPLEATESCL